jgi:RNA polymerase sigma-70 factor, ECF subfamily
MTRRSTAADPSLVTLDDNGLAAELRRGRHEALSVLFDRYGRSVFGIARRILHDYGEAEEVVQQVFLETYERIAQFDSNKGVLRSWIFRLTTLRAIDRKRQLKSQGIYRWTSIDEQGNPGRLSEAILQMSQQEMRHLVGELFRSLSVRERNVINLSFFRGLTLREVQGETNETLSSVRHLYYDALTKLRLALSSRETKGH